MRFWQIVSGGGREDITNRLSTGAVLSGTDTGVLIENWRGRTIIVRSTSSWS